LKKSTLTWALSCALAAHGLPVTAAELPVASSNGALSYDAAMAQAGQLRDQARWVDALAIFEQLQAQRPDDALLYKLRALTLADIGSSYQAWRLYRARPELFEPAQQDRLEANHLARLIVWAQAYPESERNRLDEARQADAAIQEYLQSSPAKPSALPTRVRYDRLLLLSALGRHEQVVDEYRALSDAEGQVPAYVLPAVGDSLMSLKRPQQAVPVLQAALQADPGNSAVQVQLAYAYLESEQPQRAIDHLQAMQKAQAPFLRAPGSRVSTQNWARYDADTTLAMMQAYTEDLPSAETALSQLLAIAPNNAGLQSSMGTVFLMRGWPERALRRFRIASTLDPRDVSARVGQVEALTVLQRDEQAAPLREQLLAEYPDQPNVQRMDQAWRNHRGWQARAWAGGDRSRGSTGNSPYGNRDGEVGVAVASPLLADHWRLTATADDRWADFQDERIHHTRQGVGLTYAQDRLDAALTVFHASDRVDGTGADLSLGWRFSDSWDGKLSLRKNDAEASLQARAAGITADSASVSASYEPNERRAYAATLSQFRYDDGNHRTSFNVSADQRLISHPDFLLNGLASLYTSRSSRDDAPYFNPSRDASLELGLRADHLAWRDYDHHFRHRLSANAGRYWQEGYGSAWIPSLSYRHEWQWAMGRVLSYGISWARPVYDGARETRYGFDAELRWGE